MLSIWIIITHERTLTKEVFYFIIYVFSGPSRIPSKGHPLLLYEEVEYGLIDFDHFSFLLCK